MWFDLLAGDERSQLLILQQLRAEIQRGLDELDAGQGIDGKEVFAELRERARKLTGDAHSQFEA